MLEECVEHDRLLGLPPSIKRRRTHPGGAGEFLRGYLCDPLLLQEGVRRPEDGLLGLLVARPTWWASIRFLGLATHDSKPPRCFNSRHNTKIQVSFLLDKPVLLN